MRDIPSTMTAALSASITTLCHCWLLTRRDGAEFGFTDHDRDLVVAGTVFEAASGLDASAMETERGLAIGGGEIAGALTSARILPGEIEAGLFDGAELKRWLVDWNAPALDFLIDAATLGEIRAADGRFVAETRNAMHALDQERGRLYGTGCSASLGDARCGIDLELPQWRLETAIITTDGRLHLGSPAIANLPAGHFTAGRLTFTLGANAGLSVAIKDHRQDGDIVLWQGLVLPMMPGDAITLEAGCDKRFSTCRERFANTVNFRGFPFIPAPDFVLAYARPGEGIHRGRPLVR